MGQTRKQTSRGFTLIEVLVISPIVILFIGSFVGLIVSLTGESLSLHTKNVASYDVQAALNTMEASVNQSTNFLATTTGVAAPQGKNNTGTQFTNQPAGEPETLILQSAATNRRPTDPARSLIYTGTGACDSSNPIYSYTTVFFVDTSTTARTLYKRTILPQQAACDKPWQKASCADATISSNPTICKVSDEKLLDGVSGIDLDYYGSASDTTAFSSDADAPNASTVNITIHLSKQAAGNQITYDGGVRATSLNIQAGSTQATAPATPPISADTSSSSTPYVPVFSWTPAGNATGYNIRYRIDGGSWIVGPQNQSQTSYTLPSSVTDNLYRLQTVDIEVTAVTDSGTYLYGTSSKTIPNWNSCPYANSWGDYGNGWPGGGYTKTSAKVVVLRGLIAGGTIGAPVKVCTLPVGFRPEYRLIFQASTYGSTAARVDINTDGSVYAYNPSATWLNLSSINFLASGGSVSSKALTGMGTPTWTNYGSTFSPVKVMKDNLGRGFLQGLAKDGDTTQFTNAFGDFSGGYAYTEGTNIYPAMNTGYSPEAMQLTNNNVQTRSNLAGNTYWSLQALFYPTGSASWQNFTPASGWVNYSSTPGYSSAAYTKSADNIVSLKGLIRYGTASDGTVIYTLPMGYRPDHLVMCDAITSPDVYARIDINTSGQIITREGVNTSWLSLASCDFISD